MALWRPAKSPAKPELPEREVRTDAPDAPDARVLALDVGVYGHRGSISSMFWYSRTGALHTHVAELLPDEATVGDQLDVLEALAETYPEYWRVSPVVVIGVTVLSSLGRRQVRAHLDGWYNSPWRRRLVTIGDYAGEQVGERYGTPRKKLRDLIAYRLSERTITLTKAQHDAVANYTGKRERPGRDDDDEWRSDENDAMAVPVALSCLAAATMLPQPTRSLADRQRALDRAKRAWQLEMGLSEEDAADQAVRRGHPSQLAEATEPDREPRIRRPAPATSIRGFNNSTPKGAGSWPR
ncbi:hypothetical protein [Amycolatopsis sp.]|uniref:hypothetical protein n=1 Tax=Amycolatopsis sp. TaxID=37632 RepID=UPI002D7EC7DF|nr:hypothetical protein [Amycolatopsis sp.]HET6711666.1 hypothetical protein [Amycolatopsis sp.]